MYTDTAGTYLQKYEHRRYSLMERYVHLFDARRIFSIIVPPDAEELDDVSFYQAGMKWQDYPFRSAIIRLGQNVWKDSSFETFYAEARGLGKALGGYWFYDDRVSPDAQAQVVIDAMRGKYFEKEIYIDYERRYSGSYFGLSNVKRMIELIEGAGVKCKTVGIYTGYYFWIDNTKTDMALYPFFASRPLWLAWYASPSVVKIPSPWTDYTDWQYATKVIYHGQPTAEIDVNKSRFTQTEYGNIYLGGTIPPPTGEPTVTTYTLKATSNPTKQFSDAACTYDVGPNIVTGTTFKSTSKNGTVSYRNDSTGKWVKQTQVSVVSIVEDVPPPPPPVMPETVINMTLKADGTVTGTWTEK